MYTGFSYKYTNEYDTRYMLHPYPTGDFKNPPFELITEIASTHWNCLRVCIIAQNHTMLSLALLIEKIELFSASLRIMTL